MTNVLSRASRSDLRLDPFPHIVIESALAPETYAALAASFPPPEVIAGTGSAQALASNRRYSMPAWALMLRDDVAPAWKAFLEQHTSPGFFRAALAAFEGHWDQRIADRLKAADREDAFGLLYRDEHRGRVLLDARLEINSPVTAAPSSARGAHLDSPNRLYSGLLYFRAEDDDSAGGELELFRWKSDPVAVVDVFELPADAVERVAAIPYRPNQLVMFPQSLAALHGVGIRYPTPHIRRYVFITAEVEDDWMTMQSRADA